MSACLEVRTLYVISLMIINCLCLENYQVATKLKFHNHIKVKNPIYIDSNWDGAITKIG